MAIDYDEIAASALEAIAEAGQEVVVHKKLPPDPSAPFVPGQPVKPPVADYPGTGALFGYKQRDIDGTKIMAGDQKLILAPQIETVPDTTCTVTAMHLGKLTTFSVKGVNAVGPAGRAVLYTLQLRGA